MIKIPRLTYEEFKGKFPAGQEFLVAQTFKKSGITAVAVCADGNSGTLQTVTIGINGKVSSIEELEQRHEELGLAAPTGYCTVEDARKGGGLR